MMRILPLNSAQAAAFSARTFPGASAFPLEMIESNVSETVASIVAAHRAGTATPEQTVARSYARIRAHGDAAIFISLRPEAEALAEARALAPTATRPAALWRSGRGEGQYRRGRLADDGGLSGLQLSPDARCDRGGAAARGRRHHHRQDQSRSVRHRPRRRALALWRAEEHVQCRTYSRRLELRFGGRRRRPGWCRWRSAPTPPAPAAFRPASTISSASSRASG